jgi:AAA+ ATPase superfamily predicted ATPase
MFFGRQRELDRLRDVKSLGILYGGRRLGKSSLLSQVEIENSNVPGRKAVYISMDTLWARSRRNSNVEAFIEHFVETGTQKGESPA